MELELLLWGYRSYSYCSIPAIYLHGRNEMDLHSRKLYACCRDCDNDVTVAVACVEKNTQRLVAGTGLPRSHSKLRDRDAIIPATSIYTL